ncbi:MAG: hypothetical protein HY875_05210 [Chloroflexi bacterium]|nr:hypothetical protein [Chloroflexota bacterium]
MHRIEPTPSIRGLTRIEIVLPDEVCAAIELAALHHHTTFVEMLRRCVDQTLGTPGVPVAGASTTPAA